MKKEKTNKARIEGVSVNIDAIKAAKTKKGDLAATYFAHLNPAKQQAAADALWAMVGDKDVPETAAETVEIETPESDEPGTSSRRRK